jgi:hypothetical protein
MTESNEFKGLVLFWVNLFPDMGQDTRATLEMVKEMNKPLIDQMNTTDSKYKFLFVPTFKEATRIEKIDFDEPFPLFMDRGVDVQKHGIQEKKEKEKKLFKNDQAAAEFKGIISLFINFHPETNVDIPETLELVKELNKEVIDAVNADGRFKILIIPTVKEGSRAEKVDWDSPFPRIMPGGTAKSGKP